jgi:hypothetical protein
MNTDNFSILSRAEQVTLMAYDGLKDHSTIASEVVGRVAAAALLSLSAALDLALHTLLLMPTFVYAVGKSITQGKLDFDLPWQHLQRVRNGIAPLLFGSVAGLIHPLAGIILSDPTDKHAVAGMLSSNTGGYMDTPCSPIHSLEIAADLAKGHRYAEGQEIFSDEHIEAIEQARSYEKSLESLQAQEWIHKITNLTLLVMGSIYRAIEDSSCDPITKAVVIRAAGLLIPILNAIDLLTATLAQAFFLITGTIRFLTGRGPIYTEVTSNPLTHVAFFIQNILKTVGNLIGSLVWFVSPTHGFQTSLFAPHKFFHLQLNHLLSNIQEKMQEAKEGERFVIPMLHGNGKSSVFSVPSHSMHKTYLIVEKKGDRFNLYWVNRPTITAKEDLTLATAHKEIASMLRERFPFMDSKKMMEYPVVASMPKFQDSHEFAHIAGQGNSTNCVVSNLFGMLHGLDLLRGDDNTTATLRHRVTRQALMEEYDFYQSEAFPFTTGASGYTLSGVWEGAARHMDAAI